MSIASHMQSQIQILNVERLPEGHPKGYVLAKGRLANTLLKDIRNRNVGCRMSCQWKLRY